jgi:hypothetical protein
MTLQAQTIQPKIDRINVLYQCAHKKTDDFECVFKVRDLFYFCGGEYHIVNLCIVNLYKKYERFDLNFVPFQLWNPTIQHSGYTTELQTITLDSKKKINE